jgi:hypothetical protein
MKQYVLFIAMALLAIQFQSCSSGDDDLASSDELLQSVPPPTLSRAEILDGIQKGRISGGGNTVPKERTSFYTEYMPEVDWVSALGTFTARDEKGVVEVHDNLGGLVKTEDGATFTMNIKGKGLHIEGSATTYPQSGYTYHTRVSLDIDDASLVRSNKATITNFSLSTDTEVTLSENTYTGSAYLAASNIPMVSNLANLMLTYWRGSNVIDYSYASGTSSLTLVGNPTNFIEVWISFKDGSTAKARIVK